MSEGKTVSVTLDNNTCPIVSVIHTVGYMHVMGGMYMYMAPTRTELLDLMRVALKPQTADSRSDIPTYMYIYLRIKPCKIELALMCTP